MQVRAECYAGHRGDQTPRRFELDGRAIEVVELLDQWQGSDHRYFKLRGADRNLYVLRFDEACAEWDLTLFESTRGAAIAAQPPPGQPPRKGLEKPH